MIAYIIDQVIAWGATEITMVVGHLREPLEEFLRSAYSIPFNFVEQEKMLGLGHAVLTGLASDDKEVIVILGDTILEVDLRPIIGRGITSIGVKTVEDARKFGVVEKVGERVTKLTEKSANPPSNLAIVGIYYIKNGGQLAKAINEIIEQGITVKNEYQLTDALQILINWGETIETFPVEGWFDCGKPSALLETNAFLLKRDGGSYPGTGLTDTLIIPPVSIGSGAAIARSIIGPNVSIGAGAVVNHSVVENSIFGDNIHIESSVIKDSIVGNRARVRMSEHKINIGASSEIEL